MPHPPPNFRTSFLSLKASHDAASIICPARGFGVKRSKELSISWTRKAADLGDAGSCYLLALQMYADKPYAREVGHVGEAAGDATSAEFTEGHDVPPDVLVDVVHWLRKWGGDIVDGMRRQALEGDTYCRNEGCKVVGHWNDFNVCPLCKNARYCGASCQKQDWTTGGHKTRCGTFANGLVQGSNGGVYGFPS